MRLWLVITLLLLLVGCSLWAWSSSDLDQSPNSFFRFSWSSDESFALTMPLPMTFAHADHTKQQCVSCHHNYQDDSGQGLCLDCHLNNQTVAFKMREQFHDLCMGCHIEKRTEGAPSGPLRSCKFCHTQDQSP